MKKWLMALVTVMLLAACGNTEDDTESKTTGEIIEEGTVGFEMAGENIEEATGVPADVKTVILATFDEYIASFNAEDIERYGQTTSKNAKGFNYEEDLIEAQNIFDVYAINRQAEDITIVKYSETEVQVFANMTIEMIEEATDTKMAGEGRQVTVFVHEGDAWKVSSVYSIGNN